MRSADDATASLKANIELVKNNARVGADIAVALSNLSSLALDPPAFSSSSLRGSSGQGENSGAAAAVTAAAAAADDALMAEVVVVGGLVLDVISMPSPDGDDLAPGTSNPGIVKHSLGGVGEHTL